MGQDDRGKAQYALPRAGAPPVRPRGYHAACAALSEDEAERLRNTRGFPDWDYVPPDDECPFEFKASDWGRLPDGRLVALDYSMPALD